MDKKLTVITLTWVRNPNYGSVGGWHEFEATNDRGNVFRAYRHASGYGWSWFTFTIDGKDTPLFSTQSTELPRVYQDWR